MLVVHNVAVVHRTWTPLGTVAVVVTCPTISVTACGIETSTVTVREARKKDGPREWPKDVGCDLGKGPSYLYLWEANDRLLGQGV